MHIKATLTRILSDWIDLLNSKSINSRIKYRKEVLYQAFVLF